MKKLFLELLSKLQHIEHLEGGALLQFRMPNKTKELFKQTIMLAKMNFYLTNTYKRCHLLGEVT